MSIREPIFILENRLFLKFVTSKLKKVAFSKKILTEFNFGKNFLTKKSVTADKIGYFPNSYEGFTTGGAFFTSGGAVTGGGSSGSQLTAG